MTKFLVRASIPVAAGNAQMDDPGFGERHRDALERLAPDAYYYAIEGGTRVLYLVMSVNDAPEIPVIAETLWYVYEAAVEFVPLIDPDQMSEASPRIRAALDHFAAR